MSMTNPGAVTGWLNELRVGDEVAAQRLWEEYFRRLVGLARARLAGQPRGPKDPEDVALSAFDTFCRGVAQGRFPRLNDRHDLWQLLMMLTARKAVDAIRREQAIKRGGAVNIAREDQPALEQIVGQAPTPSFAAEIAEQCRRMLDVLEPDLRAIALWKLEGYTNPEIAKKSDRSLATVERKLALIRRTWEELDADA
jgi:DNA-directed RNA polymerase specialized sigma24 family protein